MGLSEIILCLGLEVSIDSSLSFQPPCLGFFLWGIMDYLVLATAFYLSGITTAYLYFLRTNKADRLNGNPMMIIAAEFKELKKNLASTGDVLSARISALENAKHSKIYSVETMDRVTKLEERVSNLRVRFRKLRMFTIGIREHVSSLRPVHLHKSFDEGRNNARVNQ